MGDINSHVFELAETLAAVGADWLAFEVIEAIRHGRPTEHLPGKRIAIPHEVDAWEGESLSPHERQLVDVGTEPIPADDQIEFAANYVVERLSEAIAMRKASLQNLDRIASTFPDEQIGTDDQHGTHLTLGLEESDSRFTIADMDRLQSLLPALLSSLKEWTAETGREDSQR
jgi:hypothetical protein